MFSLLFPGLGRNRLHLAIKKNIFVSHFFALLQALYFFNNKLVYYQNSNQLSDSILRPRRKNVHSPQFKKILITVKKFRKKYKFQTTSSNFVSYNYSLSCVTDVENQHYMLRRFSATEASSENSNNALKFAHTFRCVRERTVEKR